jgi:hypothetical protein
MIEYRVDSVPGRPTGIQMGFGGKRTAVAATFALMLVLPVAAGASARNSTWVAKANATCRLWKQKAAEAVGSNPAQPSTPAGMFKFMLKVRPIEAGELRALRAIRLPRPAGAAKALAFGATDLSELDAGIAAYRAGQRAKFLHDVDVWQSDRRASRAFAAIGAKSCT